MRGHDMMGAFWFNARSCARLIARPMRVPAAVRENLMRGAASLAAAPRVAYCPFKVRKALTLLILASAAYSFLPPPYAYAANVTIQIGCHNPSASACGFSWSVSGNAGTWQSVGQCANDGQTHWWQIAYPNGQTYIWLSCGGTTEQTLIGPDSKAEIEVK